MPAAAGRRWDASPVPQSKCILRKLVAHCKAGLLQLVKADAPLSQGLAHANQRVLGHHLLEAEEHVLFHPRKRHQAALLQALPLTHLSR